MKDMRHAECETRVVSTVGYGIIFAHFPTVAFKNRSKIVLALTKLINQLFDYISHI